MQRRLSTSHEEGLVARLCTRYAIRTVFFDWSTPREGKRWIKEEGERKREKERGRRTGSRYIHVDEKKENIDDDQESQKGVLHMREKRRKRDIGEKVRRREDEGEKKRNTRMREKRTFYPRFREQRTILESSVRCDSSVQFWDMKRELEKCIDILKLSEFFHVP